MKIDIVSLFSWHYWHTRRTGFTKKLQNNFFCICLNIQTYSLTYLFKIQGIIMIRVFVIFSFNFGNEHLKWMKWIAIFLDISWKMAIQSIYFCQLVLVTATVRKKGVEKTDFFSVNRLFVLEGLLALESHEGNKNIREICVCILHCISGYRLETWPYKWQRRSPQWTSKKCYTRNWNKNPWYGPSK